jgi:glycosyltransferase involved in cell wall biosynthesis
VLTLFSIPKPFRGHVGVIQTNALQSWLKLEPRCEIILFGNDEGTAETAAKYNVKHVPNVARNQHGTPLLNDVFARAQAMARHNFACYVNADIILLSDFLKSAQIAARFKSPFLMVGERCDVDLEVALDFAQTDWEERLRRYVERHGRPRPSDWIDYFVFSLGLYRQVPPFVIGRTSFDNWLIWEARAQRAVVVDASTAITAIHQNHDYGHHPQGQKGIFDGPEAKINRALMGGRRRYFTISDATHRFVGEEIKRNLTGRYLRQKWKFVARAAHDWRHEHGLYKANIIQCFGSLAGGQIKPKTKENGAGVIRAADTVDLSRLTQPLPLVSVVIPCRNTGQYLDQAIESVLQQDYTRLECIVIDGASTDNTIEILRRYEGRIRWQSESDVGPPDAINKGWKLCQGEILAWLNADDLWAPGAVSTAVNHFLTHPETDVVYGDCGLIGPAGEYYTTMRVRDWDLRYAVEYCDHIIHQAASFMRREILQRVGWLHPKLCHDHDLWLRISLAGGRLRRIPALLAHARDRSDNLGNRSDEVTSLKVGLTERFFNHPELPPEFANLRRRAISNAHLRCIEYMLKDARPNKKQLRRRIIGAAWQGVRADPTNIMPAAWRLRRALKRLRRKYSRRPATLKRKSTSNDLVINPALHAQPATTANFQNSPSGPGSGG